MLPEDISIGPILILDDIRDGWLHLSALFITARDAAPAQLDASAGPVDAQRLTDFDARSVWRARFALPADSTSSYHWNGTQYDVAGDLSGDLRIAFVSCNGEEEGDLGRDATERNIMWARLRAEHNRAPIALPLHGGDQVYADEATQGHPLSQNWPEVAADPSPAALDDLRHHLRERFLMRYVAVYSADDLGYLAARVPSLMQWDDHDICDGWGSLPRSATNSAVGEALFSTAREAALLFQHAATDTDLPPRFADHAATHLGWAVRAPGLRILAPDLRSERTRRRVMGPAGWHAMAAEAALTTPGHTILLSSTPLLGPRLSLLEAMMVAIPKMQDYEDDLRDQWQSRAHRAEWRRMLRMVRDMARHDGHSITAVSGEIHLATRAEMDLTGGLRLHQLVASGITHRAPPKTWARILGALAAMGEDPLPEHPIRIFPLPGHRSRYIAERNYLLLERLGGDWQARWDLEKTGMTRALPL